MSNTIQKSTTQQPTDSNKLAKTTEQVRSQQSTLEAIFATYELPRQFNQLVIFILDGSNSMTYAGTSEKSKGYEVHQAVVKVVERLKKSKNVSSFDVSFIAYAAETIEMYPVRPVKECDLVKDCYNPCEHLTVKNKTLLTEALDLAGKQAHQYLDKYATGITKVLFLMLSDGVIHDHTEAVTQKEHLAGNDKIHFSTIFFESPHYEKTYGIKPEIISKRFAQFASEQSDHASTVDPEAIRAHMIKSITKVSKIDPKAL